MFILDMKGGFNNAFGPPAPGTRARRSTATDYAFHFTARGKSATAGASCFFERRDLRQDRGPPATP